MGRSVLASAFSARDMFQVVPGYQDISSMGREQDGGFKFINIGVQKIRNDDLTHLSDNAMPGGEGLILVGSGSYRDSQPCLAYVPLRPNEDPVLTDWRYLSGFFGAAARDSGICGTPQWSVNQSDAIFLFDDWNTLTTDENGNKVPLTQPKPGQVGELSIM